MNRAVNKRVELEMTLIRICTVSAVQNPSAGMVNSAEFQQIMEKIRQLEQQQPVTEDPRTKPHASPHPEPKPEVDMKKLRRSDFKPLPQWADILEECGKLNPAVLGTLAGSKAEVYANIMLITAENPLFLTMFEQKEHAKSLSQAIFNILGKWFVIRVKCSAESVKPRPVEEMIERAKNSGIHTTVI